MKKKPPLYQGSVAAVAIDSDGPVAGVVIFGDPGAGKTNLLLSLIEGCPWRRTALVADDAFLIDIRSDGVLRASAPAAICGLLEVRGFGPAKIKTLREVSLTAGFDLSRDSGRIADPVLFSPEGGTCPGVPIWPFRQSGRSPARIRPILRSILAGQNK